MMDEYTPLTSAFKASSARPIYLEVRDSVFRQLDSDDYCVIHNHVLLHADIARYLNTPVIIITERLKEIG